MNTTGLFSLSPRAVKSFGVTLFTFLSSAAYAIKAPPGNAQVQEGQPYPFNPAPPLNPSPIPKALPDICFNNECKQCSESINLSVTTSGNSSASINYFGNGVSLTASVTCTAAIGASVSGKVCPQNCLTEDVIGTCSESVSCSATLSNAISAGYTNFIFNIGGGASISVGGSIAVNTDGRLETPTMPFGAGFDCITMRDHLSKSCEKKTLGKEGYLAKKLADAIASVSRIMASWTVKSAQSVMRPGDSDDGGEMTPVPPFL